MGLCEPDADVFVVVEGAVRPLADAAEPDVRGVGMGGPPEVLIAMDTDSVWPGVNMWEASRASGV